MEPLRIEALFDETTYTLSYLLWDSSSRDAVVIDPVLDYDPLRAQTFTKSLHRIEERVVRERLKLHAVLETHAHADHMSGSQWLKQRFGAPVMIGKPITVIQDTFREVLGLPDTFAIDGSQFDHLINPGERLRFGTLQLEALATPGHTPACMSFWVQDAIFTGDALFMDDYGTGRCDFPRGSARRLYQSVHDTLYQLPPETRVFVGHDYLKGRPLRFETTIGASRSRNPQLRSETQEEDFVTFRRKRDASLSPPKLLFESIQVNIRAGFLPPADAEGRRMLQIPINREDPSDDVGASLTKKD